MMDKRVQPNIEPHMCPRTVGPSTSLALRLLVDLGTTSEGRDELLLSLFLLFIAHFDEFRTGRCHRNLQTK